MISDVTNVKVQCQVCSSFFGSCSMGAEKKNYIPIFYQ